MIRQVSSRIVYKNRWMTIREDQVVFPNGYLGIYGVVEKDNFALIIPFDGENFVLVNQYRYPIGRSSWEFPQGKHEGDSEITARDLAIAELMEETGFVAGSLEELGFFHEAPGYANQGFHVFLARELKAGEQQLEKTESDLTVRVVNVRDFETMVINGEITDAPTVSAFGLLKIKRVV